MRYKLLEEWFEGFRALFGSHDFWRRLGLGVYKDESRKIYDAFVEAGGNFIDTAGSLCRASGRKLPINMWAAAEADIQFTIFDSSALKKQLLIFLNREP